MTKVFRDAKAWNIKAGEIVLKLLLATGNAGKVREFQSLLRDCGVEILTPAGLGLKLDVKESGATYEENARLKAEAFAAASGLLTLADDSGLEVDALNGEPGIRSSRYAGEGASDIQRVEYLLSKLQDVPLEKRAAHFICVIALADPQGNIRFFPGRCDGLILKQPRGTNGFGYDPVFLFSELDKTMAELPEEVKNEISHRANAARKACQALKKLA
jgi:XTP/dITP diphosphohydrolase